MDVVCLRCGCSHSLPRVSWRCLQEGECPRCGYVGWAAKPNGARLPVRYDASVARRLGTRR